jgi:DNA-binding IclR family transcriptional regulator
LKLNKTDEKVVAALKEGGEMSLQEIAERTGESSKKVFRSLRKLFENEMVDTKAHTYKLCPEKLSLKGKEEAEETETEEE